MILPHDAPATLEQLCAALSRASELLGTDAVLRSTAVCVRYPEHGWLNFAVTVRSMPAAESGPPSEDIDLGTVRLLAWRAAAETIDTTDDLRLFLARWRMILGAPSGFQFQESVSTHRYGRNSHWSADPCWMVELFERIQDRGAYSLPPGPFFSDKHNLFGESLGEVAAFWLEDQAVVDRPSVSHSYRIVLTDRRARITGFDAVNNDLAVIVDTIKPDFPLRCSASRTGFRGEREVVLAPVTDGRAVLRFSGSVKRLSVWLLTPEGEWLDQYREDENRASWGPSIYNQPRAAHDPPFAALERALEAGESEEVEFKEWINAAARDPKTVELLKTAAAFANARGGDIYIGVNDDAEIVGTRDKLQRDYGPLVYAGLSAQQDAFIRDLRRLLNEGVRPSTQSSFDWIKVAGLVVLRIRIPQGQEGPYSLVESGDIYVRRGATNRKARPAELQSLRRAEEPSG